jgi:hypothetical protein
MWEEHVMGMLIGSASARVEKNLLLQGHHCAQEIQPVADIHILTNNIQCMYLTRAPRLDVIIQKIKSTQGMVGVGLNLSLLHMMSLQMH